MPRRPGAQVETYRSRVPMSKVQFNRGRLCYRGSSGGTTGNRLRRHHDMAVSMSCKVASASVCPDENHFWSGTSLRRFPGPAVAAKDSRGPLGAESVAVKTEPREFSVATTLRLHTPGQYRFPHVLSACSFPQHIGDVVCDATSQ
jgi:hypothetical protein